MLQFEGIKLEGKSDPFLFKNDDIIYFAQQMYQQIRADILANKYTAGEIIELMEGPLATVACLAEGAPPCPRAASCETLPLWAEYDKLTHEFFYGKRLSDLLED